MGGVMVLVGLLLAILIGIEGSSLRRWGLERRHWTGLGVVDKELERRGHSFARYADDCNVYVRSRKAGKRVMAVLRRCYAKLKLTVNETKSAVASVTGRKFLGYSFWYAKKGEVKRKVAAKPLATFKQRVRQQTRRSGGRSLAQIIERLRPYLLGWKAYYGLA
jgi:hypothetical protein